VKEKQKMATLESDFPAKKKIKSNKHILTTSMQSK